jgi:glycosyltransferase involved in cell wall biosynthesis
MTLEQWDKSDSVPMPNKRVTFLHYRLDKGGIDRVACLLANGFAQAGYQVDLVVFSSGGSGETALLPLLSNAVNLEFLGSSLGNRTKNLVRRFPACAKWLRQNQTGIVVSTCNNMNWIAVAAARISSPRPCVVLKTTNPVVRAQDRGLHAKLRSVGYAMAFKSSDRTLTLSDGETQLLQRQFPAASNKFNMVHNPYVTPAMLSKPGNRRTPGNRKTLIGIGRFEPQKRFDLLIKGFASMNRKDADLVLLGDGSQKAECEELVGRLKLQDRIHMPGFVSDVTEWLHQSDLLVMTSRYEGLPAVVLEALAADCRVLTTDCFPAAREILEPLDGCGIIESEIPNHIAHMMEMALGQPKDAGLRSAAENYSIASGVSDHIAQIEAAIYSRSM